MLCEEYLSIFFILEGYSAKDFYCMRGNAFYDLHIHTHTDSVCSFVIDCIC